MYSFIYIEIEKVLDLRNVDFTKGMQNCEFTMKLLIMPLCQSVLAQQPES